MNRHIPQILLVLLLLLPTYTASAEQSLIRPGDDFPELQMVTPSVPADQKYLGLTTKTFIPSQLGADLLLVELLNVHCPHCQMQTSSYNELFNLIEANPETRGRIKMLGIAAGNLDHEVKTFRQTYRVDFPILADPNFYAWRALGGDATPLTVYVRQNKPGVAGIVSGVHQGLNTHYQKLYQQLTVMAAQDHADFRRGTKGNIEKHPQLQPILADLPLEYRVRTAFTRFGMIESFAQPSLQSGRRVYTAVIRRDKTRERLFAEVISRTSVCDICHDVHFIYLFDRTARVIGFEPLQLTKYGNINWNDGEVETMRKKVVGRFLTAPRPFDPGVDAISSATMTSALIFDSLTRGEDLISELRTQNLF